MITLLKYLSSSVQVKVVLMSTIVDCVQLSNAQRERLGRVDGRTSDNIEAAITLSAEALG